MPTPVRAEEDLLTAVERNQADFVAQRLTKIAEGLRKMAEDVERRRDRVLTIPDTEPVAEGVAHLVSPYGSLVGEVQHSLLWGLANLNSDSLPLEAAQGDTYRVQRVRREEE